MYIIKLIFLYFFQFYLIVNGKRIKKKRTAAVKFNDPSNPIWNESFTFSFPQATIPVSAFEVISIF